MTHRKDKSAMTRNDEREAYLVVNLLHTNADMLRIQSAVAAGETSLGRCDGPTWIRPTSCPLRAALICRLGSINVPPSLAENTSSPTPCDAIVAGEKVPFLDLVQPFKLVDTLPFLGSHPGIVEINLSYVSSALAVLQPS